MPNLLEQLAHMLQGLKVIHGEIQLQRIDALLKLQLVSICSALLLFSYQDFFLLVAEISVEDIRAQSRTFGSRLRQFLSRLFGRKSKVSQTETTTSRTMATGQTLEESAGKSGDKLNPKIESSKAVIKSESVEEAVPSGSQTKSDRERKSKSHKSKEDKEQPKVKAYKKKTTEERTLVTPPVTQENEKNPHHPKEKESKQKSKKGEEKSEKVEKLKPKDRKPAKEKPKENACSPKPQTESP